MHSEEPTTQKAADGKNTITKEDFVSYLKCQESGVTNMFDTRTVLALTGIPREKQIVIWQNYNDLYDQYAT